MGNHLACLPSDGASNSKVVLPDGSVCRFDCLVTVAELMLDHPHHFAAEFRPPPEAKLEPLPADHNLAPDRIYLMVPMARRKTAASVPPDEARRLLSVVRPATRSLTGLGWILPLTGMCMAGVAAEATEMTAGDRVKEKTAVVEWSQEVLSRQYSSKGWKPSLLTIEERRLERKVSHWLF